MRGKKAFSTKLRTENYMTIIVERNIPFSSRHQGGTKYLLAALREIELRQFG